MHLYILVISNFSAFQLYANLVIFCNSYSDFLKELRQKSLSILISNPYNYIIPRPCAIKDSIICKIVIHFLFMKKYTADF